MIQDYQEIVGQLAVGKNRGVLVRLTELKALRAKLGAQMSEIDDYLNWFEAAKLQTPSGMFDDYFKSADGPRGRASKRKDALSIYLDAVEQEF